MNPPNFHRSKVDEDPQKFVEGVKKITEIMGLSSTGSADLATYHLKGAA